MRRNVAIRLFYIMIEINVIAVGKMKESYFAQAQEEYKKRLSRYCTLNIKEISDAPLCQNPNAKQIEKTLDKEAETLLNELKGYVFVMAIEGKRYSSEGFSKLLSQKIDGGEGVFTFVVGSSHGLADAVKKRADTLIGFSEMTFPHTLFRVMLLEQLYRAFAIAHGSAYHK